MLIGSRKVVWAIRTNLSAMKTNLFFLFYCITIPLNAQKEVRLFRDVFDFKMGDKVYVYSDLAELKEHPHKKAKNIGTVVLGELLRVDSIYSYIYSDSLVKLPDFLKVKFKKKVGYISSECLSIEKLVDKKSKSQFFFRVRDNKDSSKVLNIRKCSLKNASCIEAEVPLMGNLWSLKLTKNRGLDSLDGIIEVDYIGEGCLLENGISYVGWNEESIVWIAHLRNQYSAGIFYYIETIVFPSDSNGFEGKIVYRSEFTEVLNVEMDKSKTTILESKHLWLNGKIIPALKEEE